MQITSLCFIGILCSKSNLEKLINVNFCYLLSLNHANWNFNFSRCNIVIFIIIIIIIIIIKPCHVLKLEFF